MGRRYGDTPHYEWGGVEGTHGLGPTSSASPSSYRPGAALRARAAAYGKPFGAEDSVSGARSGKATLEVSLKGFPPANTKADGGSLFDKIEIQRGKSMQQA